MKHYVLKHCSHVGWCAECFVLFGSALIRTLCAEKSVLCDTVRIVFVLARGCFMARLEGSTLSIWNLAFIPCLASLPFLPPVSRHPRFPSVSSSHSSSSAVSPTLHSDDQLERAGLSLFISSRFSSLHILPLLCTSPLFTLHFSFPLFHLFNLIPHSVAFPSSCAISSLLSTNLLFLYLCERGPEHILISRFHISASPAAPSLVVQPWLSVWLSVCVCAAPCLNIHAKLKARIRWYTWMLTCAANMWVCTMLMRAFRVGVLSSLSLSLSPSLALSVDQCAAATCCSTKKLLCWTKVT